MVTDECPLATGENCAQLEGTQKRYRMVDEVDTSVHRMERPILAAPTHASSSGPHHVQLWNGDQGQLAQGNPLVLSPAGSASTARRRRACRSALRPRRRIAPPASIEFQPATVRTHDV